MASTQPKDNKKSILSIRLTADERKRLQESAERADLSISKFARQILLGDIDELDDLIATRGRQRPLPNWETVAEIARARIALFQIADGLTKANAIGSRITLRAIVSQLESIQNTLNNIRKLRR